MSYRNKKLLRAAKDQPCVLCGSVGTTIAAHANWQEFGKGLGCKAHDWAVAWLCQICHDTIDGRRGAMQRQEAYERWITAWIRTMTKLFELGIVVVK
jgi:hypothetical protein